MINPQVDKYVEWLKLQSLPPSVELFIYRMLASPFANPFGLFALDDKEVAKIKEENPLAWTAILKNDHLTVAAWNQKHSTLYLKKLVYFASGAKLRSEMHTLEKIPKKMLEIFKEERPLLSRLFSGESKVKPKVEDLVSDLVGKISAEWLEVKEKVASETKGRVKLKGHELSAAGTPTATLANVIKKAIRQVLAFHGRDNALDEQSSSWIFEYFSKMFERYSKILISSKYYYSYCFSLKAFLSKDDRLTNFGSDDAFDVYSKDSSKGKTTKKVNWG